MEKALSIFVGGCILALRNLNWSRSLMTDEPGSIIATFAGGTWRECRPAHHNRLSFGGMPWI